MLPRNKKKRVRKLKEILSTLSHRKLTTFTLSYEYGKGNRLAKRENDVCHSDIISGRYSRVTEIISACRRITHSKKYLNWVLRKSPMSWAYKTKQAENAYKNGVEIRTDIPANLVGFAIMSYRLSYEDEYLSHIQRWNSLVRAGVKPSLAFLMVGNIHITDNRVTLYRNGAGHVPVALDNLTCKSVYEFVWNDKFSGLSDRSYYHRPNIYGQVVSTISKRGNGEFYYFLHDRLMKDKREVKGWNDMYTSYHCTANKLTERLLKVQEDICRKYS